MSDAVTLAELEAAVQKAGSLSPPIQPIMGWRLWRRGMWKDPVTGEWVIPWRRYYLAYVHPGVAKLLDSR